MTEISRRKVITALAATTLFSPAVLARSPKTPGRTILLSQHIKDVEKHFIDVERQVHAIRAIEGTDITNGYARLANDFPLDRLRKSIGHAAIGTEGNYAYGSAVLLDGSGLVAICAHEVYFGDLNKMFDRHRLEHAPLKISFKPVEGGDTYTTTARLHKPIFRKRDLAIAQITDPDFIHKASLLPVKRGKPGYNIGQNESLVSVGYLDNRLHAVECWDSEFLASAGKMLCANQSAGSVSIWEGMSGGGVFKRDGTFCGINCSRSFDIQTGEYLVVFAPANEVWDMADMRRNKIVHANESRTPKECRVNPSRRNILGFLGHN